MLRPTLRGVPGPVRVPAVPGGRLQEGLGRGWLAMRILIVDDEIPVANVLADSVTLQGHEAVVALSGAEGLALLEREQPDAVFLDMAMPEMGGIEVLRRIREVYQTLPVIVISGRASPAQLDEAKRLGITDCIEKPSILNNLDHALRHLTPRTP